MHADTFLTEFAPLASGPGGVQKLRELVLQLAVRGKLVPQIGGDGHAAEIAARAIKAVPDKIRKQLTEAPQPYEVPSNWVWSTLGGISNYGETEKVEPGTLEDPDFWVLELEDVEKTTSRLLTRVTFRERDFRSSKNRFYEGQILYGKLRPYLDKVIVADRDGCCTTEIVPFSVYGGIDPHFIRWCMKTPDFIAYADGSTYGMNLPRMGTKSAIAAPIPLPPLAEQKRIVAKLDELMALCDALEARQAEETGLKRAAAASALHHLTEANTPQETADRWSPLASRFGELFDDLETIKGLRGSILDLAISGNITSQLTADGSATDLLEKIRQAREKQQSKLARKGRALRTASAKAELPSLPATWEWVLLDELCWQVTDGAHHTPEYTPSGVPFISVKDVSSGTLDFADTKFVSEETHRQLALRCKPAVNDILLTKVGTTGIAIKVDTEREFSLFVSVALLKSFPTLLDPDYFSLVLNSPFVKAQSEAGTQGVGNKNLVLNTIRNFDIPVAPLAEQKRIVAKVDELMALCERLEKQVREGERVNAALMASLVHALTETDQDGGGAVELAGFAEDAPAFAAPEAANRNAGKAPETKSALAAVPAQPESDAAPQRVPGVDTKFQEAVLVAAIVSAFFKEGSEPIGNFRLQKAVYFARRHIGEHVGEMAYLKKAAGPYNPSMKYSGGIAIAKQKNWLREARGRFGFGHVPGPDAGDAGEWIDTYGYGDPALWVAEHFRYKKNEEWETLATVDYAMEHLRSLGIDPNAEQILQYIRADDEWRPKIEKLALTEMSVGTAMAEVSALFGGNS
jgi:type I restriction enzyme S subunit